MSQKFHKVNTKSFHDQIHVEKKIYIAFVNFILFFSTKNYM